jgi:hypothetical protein
VRNKSRSILLVLTMAAVSCETNKDTSPLSPAPPSAPNPPVGTATVRLEGVVVDADREELVAGAAVKVVQVFAGNPVTEKPEWSATTDSNGTFAFTAGLPAHWSQVMLEGTRPGYERTPAFVNAATPEFITLKLIPTVTIRPGESLVTRIYRHGYTCFFESWACRRVIVDSPSGEPVDIEMIPVDTQAPVGLEGPESSHPLFPTLQRRLTVSGGDIWMYGGVGDGPSAVVRLTAIRH